MDGDSFRSGGRMVKSTRSRSVPTVAQAVDGSVVALTDAFCRIRPFCDIDPATASWLLWLGPSALLGGDPLRRYRAI
jgi:hypothetical protein